MQENYLQKVLGSRNRYKRKREGETSRKTVLAKARYLDRFPEYEYQLQCMQRSATTDPTHEGSSTTPT